MLSSFFKIGALFAVITLSGCASPPRTPAADTSIKSVGVVSLLNESTTVQKIGLTVFNNESRTIPMGGELNRIVVSNLESRLRQTRPSWTIVQMDADIAPLRAKVNFGRNASEDQLAVFKSEVLTLARTKGIDAVFMVGESSNENVRGRGVGVVLHAPAILPARAQPHAVVSVVLIDKDGKLLGGAGGSESINKGAGEFGLTGSIESLDSPVAQDRIKVAYRELLVKSLNDAVGRMGY
ncbi:MAG: hypothetical protein H7Y28_14370 [Rhodoferax sp.]|nr:hypothetical protein [Rhodoferax sp.]